MKGVPILLVIILAFFLFLFVTINNVSTATCVNVNGTLIGDCSPPLASSPVLLPYVESSEFNELKERVDNLNEKIGELNERIEKLETKIAKLNESIIQLEKNQTKENTILNLLDNDVLSLRNEIRSIKDLLNSLLEKINNSEKSLLLPQKETSNTTIISEEAKNNTLSINKTSVPKETPITSFFTKIIRAFFP